MAHETHDDGIYLKVLIALGVLTVLTVLASSKAGFVHFGAWSLAVCLIIASVKAGLVAIHFMHLKTERVDTWIYVIFPLILLVLMMGGVFIDNPFRTGTGQPDPNAQAVAVETHSAPAAQH
ncbi:MAG: cytochrome C oxidase subunit IV family protein [Bdellovibrionales bacterium]|nr:cytochrome C oxidase subunit IV family protein [Bdellovibrionales bacterium]